MAYQECSPIGQITLRKLAWRTRIRIDLLRTMIDVGALEVIEKGRTFSDTIVQQPSPARLEWIRQMLKPLHMRPLIRLSEVAEMLNLKYTSLKEDCDSKGLKFRSSPTYGELLTPQDVGRILRADIVPKMNGRWRFDRMSLIQFLTGDVFGAHMKYRILPYSSYLEREVKRIARLKEPDRTFRAVALYESLKDAKTVAECWREYRERRDNPEVVGVEKLVDDLMSLVASGS
jgi:hypothetical protein